MTCLSAEEIGVALADLEGWAFDAGEIDAGEIDAGEIDAGEIEAGEIVREVRLANFRDAVGFVVRLAFEAESANHHPDLDIRYNRVTVRLSTHSAGGVTAKDIDLARAVNQIVGG